MYEDFGDGGLTNRLAMLLIDQGGPVAERVLKWLVYGEDSGDILTLPGGSKVDIIRVEPGEFLL